MAPTPHGPGAGAPGELARAAHLGAIETFDHREFPLELVLECKAAHVVSVCIPARDEARTVSEVVATVHDELVGDGGLVDELVVIDDGSRDATATLARQAGARVEPSVPLAAYGRARSIGKGGAMRRGLEVTSGDIVVFLDADVTNLRSHFVTALVGPLLCRAGISLVKACYERPLGKAPNGGGRVTELVARPIIALLFPELASVAQPLAGETAVRREVLGSLGLDEGYGVEMGLLVDVAAKLGTGAIAQVDLGRRAHRNRPLEELVPQARQVLAAALARTRTPFPRNELGP